jgi:hypothetical protein
MLNSRETAIKIDTILFTITFFFIPYPFLYSNQRKLDYFIQAILITTTMMNKRSGIAYFHYVA